ncbi:MAG: hypothetical protein H6867_11110 [Rhodospirillales bacterium]|nr:hypothetical protein [Rhodospirillales bacterium]MCB9996678.1 hypothetical protein [Rhodospirillales bacterium]
MSKDRLFSPSTFILLCGGWVVIMAVMASLWSLPVLSGGFYDPDDYMRMVRVFSLLDGHDDPSYAAPGLGVGAAAELGWSRIIDMPLVLVQGLFEKSMARIPAAMMTATVMPALLLLLYMFAAHAAARPLTGGRSAFFTVLGVLLLWGALRQFMPGRVDHHMVQILLGSIAFGGILNLWAAPHRMRYAVTAGIAMATGLAIGADSLPWLTMNTALLGWFWLARGQAFEKAGLIFGVSTAGMAMLWLVLLHDAGRLMMPSCDSLSIVWALLATVMALFWLVLYVLPQGFKSSWRKRLGAGVLTAVPLLAALYVLFPQCFHDPYMITDPQVRTLWLSIVKEAQPLPALYQDSTATALIFAVPVVIVLAAVIAKSMRRSDDRALWIGLSGAVFFALLLTFYQVRTVDFAHGLIAAPMIWLLAQGKDIAGTQIARLNLSRGQRLAASGSFFILMLVFFGYALSQRDPEAAQKTLQPAASCNLRTAAAVLGTLPAPQTIAAHIDEGAELLFRTDHHVLAAPYHRNQQGILAVYEIFSAPGPQQALAAMDQYGADILVLCREDGRFWGGFAQQLLNGDIPKGLSPVDTIEKSGGYLILNRVK